MVKWLGDRFQELHMGSMVVNKVGLIVNLFTALVVVSVKWDFDPTGYILIIIPAVTFLIWFIGFVFEITGLRENFMKSQFKGLLK